MSFHAHLQSLVLNTPLLITPEKAQVILSVLGSRVGVDMPMTDRFVGDMVEERDSGLKLLPYRKTTDGVAIISIVGTLVNRGAYIGASSGLVSYEGIKHQLKEAVDDSSVKSVLLDIQSPGGEAVGAFECAELVRVLAAKKRTVALVNGMAASAAYAIASGASEIVSIPTGISGSIGVVLLHAEETRRNENEGIKPTLIFAGRHKVDGNPFEPLSENVRQNLQAEVDSLYSAFLECVAEGRGKRLTAQMAEETGARTFFGRSYDPNLDAVKNGLVDSVGTFESVLEDLSRARGGRISVPTRGTLMTETTSVPAAENAGISQADHDAAVTAAEAKGRKDGAKAERGRLSSILSSEGIKGNAARMNLALELAAEAPEMTADKVIDLTTKHVSDEPAATSAAGMSLAERQSDADPLGSAGSGQASKVDSIVASHRAVSGASSR